jgi:hypothetical protein
MDPLTQEDSTKYALFGKISGKKKRRDKSCPGDARATQ